MSVILVCAQHAVLWLREISLQFLFYPICFKLLFDHLSLAAHPEEQKVESRLVCFSLSPIYLVKCGTCSLSLLACIQEASLKMIKTQQSQHLSGSYCTEVTCSTALTLKTITLLQSLLTFTFQTRGVLVVSAIYPTY